MWRRGSVEQWEASATTAEPQSRADPPQNSTPHSLGAHRGEADIGAVARLLCGRERERGLDCSRVRASAELGICSAQADHRSNRAEQERAAPRFFSLVRLLRCYSLLLLLVHAPSHHLSHAHERSIHTLSVCDSLDPLPRLYPARPSSSSTLVVAWCLRGFCARVQLVRANQRSRVVLSYSLLNA